jgi:hypothetical protein
MTQHFFLSPNPILTWQAWARTAAAGPSIKTTHPTAEQSSKRPQVQAWATATRQRVLQGSTHSWMTQPATSKQATSMLRRNHRLDLPAAKVQPLLCGCCCFLSFASHCLLVTDFLLYCCCNAAYCAVLRCCVALHRVVQLVYCALLKCSYHATNCFARDVHFTCTPVY